VTDTSTAQLCDWSAVNMPGLCGCEPTSFTGRVLCVACQLTDAEIATDLRELSPDECAARGILHSSADDRSTGLRTGDSFELRQGALRSAARRASGRVVGELLATFEEQT
jgi:hypothetical protein